MYKNYRFSRRLLLTMALILGSLFLAMSFIFIIEPPRSTGSFSFLLNRLRETYVNITDLGLLRTLFPIGVMMALFLGAPHIFSGLLLVARMKAGIFLAMSASILLIIFTSIGMITFSDKAIVWFLLFFGIIELIVSYICYVTYYKYSFYFNELDYTEINKNNKEMIVVFYSRDSYIKKYAYEYANKHKCSIYEIKTKEDLSSNRGFFKLVYSTLLCKEIECQETKIDFSQYKKVYLITGVIFRTIAAPVIDFCKQNRGKIKNVDYNFVHYTPIVHKYSKEKLDEILQTNHERARAICMHFGKVLNFNPVHQQKEKKRSRYL